MLVQNQLNNRSFSSPINAEVLVIMFGFKDLQGLNSVCPPPMDKSPKSILAFRINRSF
jgi:hypothetical protein